MAVLYGVVLVNHAILNAGFNVSNQAHLSSKVSNRINSQKNYTLISLYYNSWGIFFKSRGNHEKRLEPITPDWIGHLTCRVLGRFSRKKNIQ
tara:strand:+ start:83 stop:358 length:276 start_codon:yes stop_codon:yes gene_type:complete